MSWRLLRYEEFDAATNMAIDEAILEAHLAGEAPATLRLYGWQPSTISIGYSQTISEEALASIQKAGLAVVRRPTGGRAVLHMNDLTYAFIGTSIDSDDTKAKQSAPSAVAIPHVVQKGLLSRSIGVAYKQICAGLIKGLDEFGIKLEMGVATSDYRTNYDCFHATTNADLHYQGKKMIGSAQLRRKNGVLQHGSILLKQEQNKMASIFGVKQDADKSRHANLFEVLERTLSMDELEQAIHRGFETAFETTIAPSSLTSGEKDRLREVIPKYQNFSTSP